MSLSLFQYIKHIFHHYLNNIHLNITMLVLLIYKFMLLFHMMYI